MDGVEHTINGKWDLIIAHPPCTYLSNAGATSLFPKGVLNKERFQKGLKGKDFFMQTLQAECEHICVENPTPSRIYELPPCSQAIQPWQFGHPYTKRTCLWLRGLPLLKPTEIVSEEERIPTAKADWYQHGGKDRQRNRSKTFHGIAVAMAEQWGDYLNQED